MAFPSTASKPQSLPEKEVFTPTVPFIKGERCDACGGNAVSASYEAVLNGQSLFFCGHHIRQFNSKLSGKGFKITPEDISYDAAVVKTK